MTISVDAVRNMPDLQRSYNFKVRLVPSREKERRNPDYNVESDIILSQLNELFASHIISVVTNSIIDTTSINPTVSGIELGLNVQLGKIKETLRLLKRLGFSAEGYELVVVWNDGNNVESEIHQFQILGLWKLNTKNVITETDMEIYVGYMTKGTIV